MENWYQNLRKTYPKLSEDILSEYRPHDEYVVINVDQDLHPVYIKLPEPPPLHTITNWGLPASKQYFVREKMPQKLTALVSQCETVEEIWEALEQNQGEYYSEIGWIQNMWHYRLHGKWYWINGKPVYLDGWHFMYCNFWKFNDGKIPDYRERNWKYFHSMRYAYTTTEKPETDKDGRLVYEDRQSRRLKMVETGNRTFNGVAYPKHRRDGATNMCGCAMYCETSIREGVNSGIVSMTGEHAKNKIFNEIVVPGWQQMPFFFKPIYSGNEKPEKELAFFASRKKAGARLREQLRSRIDYSETSKSTFYDGGKNLWLLVDESGKCFARGTKIRMYDGSVKNVEDIDNGELVMGNDSTPRLVHGKTFGIEEMYEIRPKKGKSFVCNRSHILSCVVMDRGFTYKKKKYKFNDILNIPVFEYLKMTKCQKKILGLYRVGWEYEENEHKIEPYFIGMWLGDGHSRGTAITTIDTEVIDYIKKKADDYGLFVHVNPDMISYRMTTKVCGKDNFVLSELRNLNLLQNKHIPKKYLIDSRENRMQLLAGLVDSDGHVDASSTTTGAHRSIEITQKNPVLSMQIQELCLSLGFYCSLNKKTATMKRKDGSVYSCEVSRMMIYGDIDKIPTKVKRKQAVVSRTKNRRNPLRSGFSVVPVGLGEYYGFAVDQNHLFLLDDGTVVHNTTEDNVYSRHQQLKNCVAQGNGANIIGFISCPSTVGEMMGQGGKNYFDLCQDSRYERRDISGQTKTGMLLIYLPATEGLEGFIDEYGSSVVEKPTQRQAKYINKPYGSREYLDSKREQLLADGDILKYNEEVRLFPTRYMECFRTEDGEIGFNTKIINDRLDELAFIGKKMVRRGNFKWENNEPDTKVIWEDHDNGRFYMSQMLKPEAANRFYWDGEHRHPVNPKYTACGDTFKFNKVQHRRMSNGGGAVFWHYDQEVDGKTTIEHWQSNRFVCTYNYRPETVDEYCEDMLMMCVYFGSWMYPEINVPKLWEYFEARGYGGYLKYDVDIKTGKQKVTPGFNSEGGSKQDLFNGLRDYLQRHGKRERHGDLLNECKEIKSIEEMTDYDLLTAAGGALLGAKAYLVTVKKPEAPKQDITDYFETFSYKRMRN